MRNNDDMERMLSRSPVETHPREEHRSELRNQMLSVFQNNERRMPSSSHLRVWRWTEHAAVLAAGVVLGLGCSWFLRVNQPTRTEQPTVQRSVVLVVEHASPEATPNDSQDSRWVEAWVEKYREKSRSTYSHTTPSTQKTFPLRLSNILGEI